MGYMNMEELKSLSKDGYLDGKKIAIFGIIILFIGILIGMFSSSNINIEIGSNNGSNNGNNYFEPDLDEWEDFEDEE